MGKPCFEVTERLAHIVGDFCQVNAGEVVASLNPINLIRIEKENPPVDFDPNAVRRRLALMELP